MKLVTPDFISDEDKEIQRLLNEHPDIKNRLTWLINGYRSSVHNCMERMTEAHIDIADTLRDCWKSDAVMRRYDIEVFETLRERNVKDDCL